MGEKKLLNITLSLELEFCCVPLWVIILYNSQTIFGMLLPFGEKVGLHMLSALKNSLKLEVKM